MLARMLTRGLVITMFGLLLAAPPASQASSIQTQIDFSTTGSVDSFNVSGTPVVTFQGASGLINSGTPFSLGSFAISAPPGGTTTTYTNIPFQIMFKTEAVSGGVPSPNETPVILTGMLNGTVTEGAAGSTPQTNLSVTYSAPPTPVGFIRPPPYPVNSLPFQTGNLMNYLSVTSQGSNGQPVMANLITTPNVPEPSSIAIFACLTALAVWQKRRLASR